MGARNAMARITDRDFGFNFISGIFFDGDAQLHS
jgi:hypothetical protein